MNFDIVAFIPRAVMQGIPLLYGSTGEILTEKSGNLNLGIPGIMYVGGICGVVGAFFYEQAVPAAEMNGLLAVGIPMLCSLLGSLLMGLLYCLLTVTLLSLVGVLVYAFRMNLSSTLITVGLFLCTMIFLPTTDYIFNSILKQHQRDRILSFLGIISDPLGTDYNVNQSKIAIGSGGFWGKGFLEGTQIKYGFVPERHTDFIFCTVGEEWGFLGTMVVLALLCMLILRLMRMGERQQEPFGRIYCYCVAAILLFHVLVNVGMTIGLMPVMGIPLPFMSYGGSSLIAFTILLFIAVRLDASTRQFSLN